MKKCLVISFVFAFASLGWAQKFIADPCVTKLIESAKKAQSTDPDRVKMTYDYGSEGLEVSKSERDPKTNKKVTIIYSQDGNVTVTGKSCGSPRSSPNSYELLATGMLPDDEMEELEISQENLQSQLSDLRELLWSRKKEDANSPKIQPLQVEIENLRKDLHAVTKDLAAAQKNRLGYSKQLWELCATSPRSELSNVAKQQLNRFKSPSTIGSKGRR